MMNHYTDLLTSEERETLNRKTQHDVGDYRTRGKDARDCQFRVIINTYKLVNLIDSARYGARVYELLSIQRPGDLLHYLWVEISQLDDDLIRRLEKSLKHTYPYESSLNPKVDGISFIDFDNYFSIFAEGNEPEDVVWRRYVDFDKKHSLKNDLTQLFMLIKQVKERISKSDDELTKHELTLIHQKQHPQDYLAQVDRKSVHIKLEPQWEKYEDFYQLVAKLAADEDIQSISCPFGGFEIWRTLVKAQVLRVKKTGLPAMEALSLYGPDEGLGRLTKPENWGGEVFIPYEGIRMANLMFLPNWRVFHVDKAGVNGSLKEALNSNVECKYLFVLKKDRDFGVLGCSRRTEVGGWILYSQKN
ncbi:MAG: hypothetical protein ACSHWN_07055 [Methylophilaceae bacterium]